VYLRLKTALIRALSDDERARLVPHLHRVRLALGDVIYEPGGCLDHIYFPASSVVSLLYTMEDGVTAEMAARRLAGARLGRAPRRCAHPPPSLSTPCHRVVLPMPQELLYVAGSRPCHFLEEQILGSKVLR
jgi:hypothetical protein